MIAARKDFVTNMRPDGVSRPGLACCILGNVPYKEAWDLQKQLQARLIDLRRQDKAGLQPHLLLLVEHPPVYTLGKSGKRDHLKLDADGLRRVGASFYPIGRGGDITYHGPGQLVGYPILDLRAFHTDLTRYVRTIEEVVIRTCADFGIAAHRSNAGTGVWIGSGSEEQKVCAIGIRCSRWVSMHGFAFNLNTDLRFFEHIIPCGIADRGVTTLAKELGEPVDESFARERLVAHFTSLFGTNTVQYEGRHAHHYLATYR